jgi:hypothetical protein
MEKFEYFSGIPEVGIVPRAPHAGPLMRHVYEQEHGRGGFAGKVSHTYHLYPPTNWLPEESRLLDGAGFAPHWESPLRQHIGQARLAVAPLFGPALRRDRRELGRAVYDDAQAGAEVFSLLIAQVAEDLDR